MTLDVTTQEKSASHIYTITSKELVNLEFF